MKFSMKKSCIGFQSLCIICIFIKLGYAFGDGENNSLKILKNERARLNGMPILTQEPYTNVSYKYSDSPILKGNSSSNKLMEFLSQLNNSFGIPETEESEHINSKPLKFKHGMSKIERSVMSALMYQKQLEDIRQEEPKANLFDQLKEWNEKQGFSLSKGTCDRRALKICKNSCMRTYNSICQEYRCRKSFKHVIRKNCNRICKVEFKREFRNIF